MKKTKQTEMKTLLLKMRKWIFNQTECHASFQTRVFTKQEMFHVQMITNWAAALSCSEEKHVALFQSQTS